MDQEQLNAIKERVAKATRGEWECRYLGHSRPQYSVVTETEYVAHIYDVNDAEFIAFAREDVPALIAEVERLQKEKEALEFHLKVSVRHAEELDEELESEVAENEQLRKALEQVMEVEAPNMEGWETLAYKIAREALGGEAHE